MQQLSMMDSLSNMEIQEELAFVCSAIAFVLLIAFRNQKSRAKKRSKLSTQVECNANDGGGSELDDDKYYVKMDKALRDAFEKEDYWQVLNCWWELKHFNQSAIHLPMVMRAMRFCNKGGFFIANEVKSFFQAHPQECSIGLLNDLLEPLARRTDDAQLVDLLVKVMPSLNLTKDSRTYEIVLTMHAADGKLTKIQDVMADMKSQGIAFTPRATVAVLTLGLRAGNADVVLKAFDALKPFWNERGTWAVSMFALDRHKVNVLMQVVTLACQALEVCELSKTFDAMSLPEEVLEILRSKFSALSDGELASSIEALEDAGVSPHTDGVYAVLLGCKKARSKIEPSPPGKMMLRSKFSSLSDSELASSIKALEDAGVNPTSDPVYAAMLGCKKARSNIKASPPWKMKKSSHAELSSLAPPEDKRAQWVNSDASTREDSRSESEEETKVSPYIRPPPGLAPPVC